MDKNEYKKIVNDLIKKSFPILRGKKIHISYFFLSKEFSGASLWIPPFMRIIFINRGKKFTREQLNVILAHELCHFELFKKRGGLGYLFMGFRYWTSFKFRKEEEERTEKLTIKKGYARECYAIAKRRNKKSEASKYYLTAQEIKSYAKKIKKW